MNGASNSKDEKISIGEFKILKSAYVHAPVFYWTLKPLSETYTIYYLNIMKTSNEGELIKIYKKINDENFTTKEGYRDAENQQIVSGMRPGQVHQYYTATYKDAKIN